MAAGRWAIERPTIGVYRPEGGDIELRRLSGAERRTTDERLYDMVARSDPDVLCSWSPRTW